MYEIRRGKEVLCSSSVPGCGYPNEILRDMSKFGLQLFCDNKRIKNAATGRSRTDDSQSAGVLPNTPRITEIGGKIK